MKRLILLFGIVFSVSCNAQENLKNLLAAGISDAQRFTKGYTTPASESMIYNTANGWIQSAEVKRPLKFEISIIGIATFIKDENRTFVINTANYNNLNFIDGSTSKEVATAFGKNDPDITVYSQVQNGPIKDQVNFVLPQGLASVNVNVLPTAFLQARIGVFKATELKVRYFPKIDRENVKVGVFGLGIQQEFTKWLPAEKVFPLAISGLVAFNNLNANYNFTDVEIIDGQNQQFNLKQKSWIFQLQASTKLRIFNVYGGIGYIKGTSNFDVLGTYKIRAGIPILETSSEFVDPFGVETKVSGIRGTLGMNLKLGFFGIHADYNMAKFNNASVGLHFGI